ncbi:MAG: prepilin-type N-terminal cleavage/methylation domain-containing protein [Candidatus Omnitrophica bacterium]|nr:prepilin-type N-terminal cleavage/methylation domain-containing protein [Candidatus Omnitrophota bacterium]
MKRQRYGFTLIELLIVVAIIAILAAIAVPNFLEAQTRAKVSRVKSDLRTLATGLESYMVDQNRYPPGRERGGGDRVSSLWRITTPVAYVSSSDMIDPFITMGATGKPSDNHGNVNMYLFFTYIPTVMDGKENWATAIQDNSAFKRWGPHNGWCLTSPGPDRDLNGAEWVPINLNDKNYDSAYKKIYDATNGTKSAGDIPRYGGDVGTASIFN